MLSTLIISTLHGSEGLYRDRVLTWYTLAARRGPYIGIVDITSMYTLNTYLHPLGFQSGKMENNMETTIVYWGYVGALFSSELLYTTIFLSCMDEIVTCTR